MFSIKKQHSLFHVFASSIGLLFVWIASGLLLDSKYVIPYFPQGQIVADIAIAVLFGFAYQKAVPKVRELMFYAVLIAICGECLFSLVLEMYTYRLHNVPVYVFFGHALLYIAVLYFSKSVVARQLHRKLELYLTVFVLLYATAFLIFLGDVFGFVLSGLTLYTLRNRPRERLFYLTMYVCVAFLEIAGTQYQCWFWPRYFLGIEATHITSSNPPCGISFFYFGLDLGCLYFYSRRHRTAWKRMKNIRSLKETIAAN